MKKFIIIQGTCYKNLCSFFDLRKASENIVNYLNHKIDRYYVGFRDQRKRMKNAGCSYKEENYKEYDNCSLLTFCSFVSTPKKKDFNGQLVSVCFDMPFDPRKHTITIVWESDAIDKQLFQNETNNIIEILSSLFSFDYIFADCMDSKKSVEAFVQGILEEAEDTKKFTRSTYENEIAQNINQYIYQNGKIPFLFAYTSIKKVPGCSPKKDPNQIEFVNLDLLNRDLEEYSKDPAWNQCYHDWIEKGIIAPLPPR